MYFIPWAVLLVFVILAVPIASWLEKRKMRAAYGETSDTFGDDEIGDEAGEASEGEAVAEEGGGEDVLDGDAGFGEEGGFGGEGEFGGDEFSAFEEVT